MSINVSGPGQEVVDHPCLSIIFVLLIIPLSTFIYTSLRSRRAVLSHGVSEPPMLPYTLPGLGHLLRFLDGTDSLANQIVQKYDSAIPVQFRLGPIKSYLASDVGHADTLLRSKGIRGLRSDAGIMLGMKLLFGLKKKDQPFYDADNSAISNTPAHGSTVDPRNRIHFLRHTATSKYFNIPNVRDMTSRFLEILSGRLRDHEDIGSEWVEMPDFATFVQKEVFRAATSSMCGPYLISLNPSFIDDFADYISYLPIYVKMIPRWIQPRPYVVRDRLLESYKKWHQFALEHSPLDKDIEGTWDPYWGSQLLRERYSYAMRTDGMTADSIASEDLGILFATSSNAIPATIWFCLHIFRNPALLSRVRHEVAKAQFDGSNIDVTTLCQSPLLQSMFAETLRLYQGVAMMRSSDEDFTLGRWRIRKNRIVFLCSRILHLNANLWNTGTVEEPHPVTEFWADRFLYNSEDGPSFSTKELPKSWVPFGGGATMCPGRGFAKNEMLASFALLSTHFDVELMNPEVEIKPDMRFYAIGTLPPKGKMPFRIRRRNHIQECESHGIR